MGEQVNEHVQGPAQLSEDEGADAGVPQVGGNEDGRRIGPASGSQSCLLFEADATGPVVGAQSAPGEEGFDPEGGGVFVAGSGEVGGQAGGQPQSLPDGGDALLGAFAGGSLQFPEASGQAAGQGHGGV